MTSLEYQDKNTPPPYPPPAGCQWVYCTKPDDWEKEENGGCWCGHEWGTGDNWYHDDGYHGLWMALSPVEKSVPKQKKLPKQHQPKKRTQQVKVKIAKAKKKLAKAKDKLAKAKADFQEAKAALAKARA